MLKYTIHEGNACGDILVKMRVKLFRLLIMVKESISSISFDIYNGCSRSVIYRHLVFIHLFFSSNLKKNIKLVFQI
jgi:hypothetical protein